MNTYYTVNTVPNVNRECGVNTERIHEYGQVIVIIITRMIIVIIVIAKAIVMNSSNSKSNTYSNS